MNNRKTCFVNVTIYCFLNQWIVNFDGFFFIFHNLFQAKRFQWFL
jgi:hypothetical protein